MSIYDKIEEIRQKPEHIRKRYVWVCVAVSMVIVIAIWTLSLKSQRYQVQTAGEVAGQASIFDELKEQKESLNQYKQEMGAIKGDLEKSMQEAQNIEGFSGSEAPADIAPAASQADLFQ